MNRVYYLFKVARFSCALGILTSVSTLATSAATVACHQTWEHKSRHVTSRHVFENLLALTTRRTGIYHLRRGGFGARGVMSTRVGRYGQTRVLCTC